MAFKGRTVLVFMMITMLASSIITILLASPAKDWLDRVQTPREEASQGTPVPKPGLTDKEIQKIVKTYQLIENKFVSKVDKEKVLNGAINGMLDALEDPYSVYMDEEEAKSFEENVESTFTGIGAEVSLEGSKVTVVSPIKDSPAEKAGIRSKDVIISVNGVSLEGLKLNEAVMKIRGPKGTKATLEILRSDAVQPIEIIVVRDDINIETIYSEMLDHLIGKIDITQFSQHTADRFLEELTSLESQGMKGLIIDVRNDPGGYLEGVIQILNSLVPEGKALLQIESRDRKEPQTLSEGLGKTYPIAVLMNKGSASASEILAAALQQSADAKLVGETTYGKGTVQTTYAEELGDGSNIKMTIAKWLTPKGEWINGKGVTPDIPVEQPGYYNATPIIREPVMKKDTTGDQVKNLQIMLAGLGLKPDRMDGYFSEKTALAVRSFQSLHKLPLTGDVDAKTAAALEEAIIAKIQEPGSDLQLNAAVKYLEELIAK
ncbi:MAG TPA: S41 family peptidase [Bacilli bacterium]